MLSVCFLVALALLGLDVYWVEPYAKSTQSERQQKKQFTDGKPTFARRTTSFACILFMH